MSEIKGFSPRQEKKAIKLHNDYVQRSIEQEPGTVVGTRKAARHFRKNEQAYIEQAVLDAQQAGKEIDYPPYTPRRLPESDQVPEPQFKSDTAMYANEFSRQCQHQRRITSLLFSHREMLAVEQAIRINKNLLLFSGANFGKPTLFLHSFLRVTPRLCIAKCASDN